MRFKIRFLFGLLIAISLASAEDFRTWNTISGGFFEAKLNSVNNTTVSLENEEGKVIEFPLADLKPSDQKFVREWQIAQAGDLEEVLTAAADRSDFAKGVYRDLVIADGSRLKPFSPSPAEAPRYFAFYRSASWCPPCRGFTPDLVDFYNSQKRKGASFELILMSSDRSEQTMAKYMDDYDMKWPAFKFGENLDIVRINSTGIPNLIVTDANGKKLLESYDDSGGYLGPQYVLEKFEDMLKETY